MKRMGGALLIVALFSACPPPAATCDAASCALGCCSAAGVCETGLSASACGTGGAACGACAEGTSCSEARACVQATGTGGGGGSFDDGGATRTVTISRSNVFHGETGDTTDTSIADAGIALYVSNFSTLTEIVGTRSGERYVVNDVPRGPFIVRYDNAFIETSSNTVDLGTQSLGRADAERFSADASVSVTFATSGFPAWGDLSLLDVFSQGANISILANPYLNPEPTTGAVPSTLTADYLGLSEGSGFSRLDQSKGDSMYLSHKNQLEVGNDVLPGQLADGGADTVPLGCDVLTHAAHVTTLTVAPGANVAVANFSDMPAATVGLDFAREEWRARAAEVHPQAFVILDTASVNVSPPGALTSFTLVSCNNSRAEDTGPLTPITRSFTVANPVPASWEKKSLARLNYRAVAATPDGGVINMRASGGVLLQFGERLVPGVHAPEALKIQGTAANLVSSVVAGVPLAISWTKSSVAPVADRFIVTLEGTPFTAITTGDHFTFPSGLMVPGKVYYVRVEADVMDGATTESQPYFLRKTSYLSTLSNPFVAQ